MHHRKVALTEVDNALISDTVLYLKCVEWPINVPKRILRRFLLWGCLPRVDARADTSAVQDFSTSNSVSINGVCMERVADKKIESRREDGKGKSTQFQRVRVPEVVLKVVGEGMINYGIIGAMEKNAKSRGPDRVVAPKK